MPALKINIGVPLIQKMQACEKRIIVNQGGSRSMKTWSTLIIEIIKCINKPCFEVIVIGRDIPFLHDGPIKDTKKILSTYEAFRKFLKPGFQEMGFNSSRRAYEFSNGSYIQFNAFDDPDDAKRSDFDDFFINEANTVVQGYEIYRQLRMRMRGQGYIDYNPAAPFWVHDKVIGSPDSQLFITDHRTNLFLPEYRHEEIESYKKTSYEYWKVYARGLTGQIEALIYKNCEVIDEWPSEIDDTFWGIDWGYSIGATAVLKIGYNAKQNTLYLKGCCYQPAVADEEILKILKANGYDGNQYVWCDPDPDKVNNLRSMGVPIVGASKPPSCELNAIQRIQQMKIRYLYDENLASEFARYQFEILSGSSTSDSTSQEIISQKVKNTKNFHYMAALRYGVFSNPNIYWKNLQ